MKDENMNEESVDKTRLIGMGFIIGVIVSVLSMEYYGYIQHPTERDSATVDTFSLLSLSSEHQVKVSPKASGKIGFCSNGYLLVRPDNEKEHVAGILVDGKNRAIQCDQDFDRTSIIKSDNQKGISK